MSDRPRDFLERYAATMEEYLSAPEDEVGLEKAYELGRQAVSEGIGVLDLAATHASELARRDSLPPGLVPDLREKAMSFFAEALAPYEMALRGFQEANRALRASAAELERRVAEKTRILSSILASISDGIVVADENGKLVLANTASKETFGIDPTAGTPEAWISGSGLFEGDASTPLAVDRLPLVRAIRGEQTSAIPIYVKNLVASRGLHASVIGSPLRDDKGAVVGGVVVFRDVTEERRAQEALRKSEEQLRQSQKMDAIGRLAGGIAHDFNNILSVIISYTELSLMDLAPNDPTRGDVEEVYKAARRATDLTRQLLMFSRQQVMEPRTIDLNDLLRDLDKMLRRILGADIELVSVFAPRLGRIRADPTAIEQVVVNLVVNARDAMPRGGKLTVETGNVVLDDQYVKEHSGARPGRHVMLAVTDTGSGMGRATLARIFEPFFTTKQLGKGTGLGLSTVFGIVQQNGGNVWVYSEPGQGTSFKIYLPAVDAEIDVHRSSSPPRTVRGSETILVVDDEDQVRSAARAILMKHGYHVIEARNAGEAILQSEGYAGVIHLLLTDVVMPHMSGPELAKRLIVARPDLRVLCMSGYTDDTVVRHGVLDAPMAYLQKPLSTEALTRRVREVLDRDDGG